MAKARLYSAIEGAHMTRTKGKGKEVEVDCVEIEIVVLEAERKTTILCE